MYKIVKMNEFIHFLQTAVLHWHSLHEWPTAELVLLWAFSFYLIQHDESQHKTFCSSSWAFPVPKKEFNLISFFGKENNLSIKFKILINMRVWHLGMHQIVILAGKLISGTPNTKHMPNKLLVGWMHQFWPHWILTNYMHSYSLIKHSYF